MLNLNHIYKYYKEVKAETLMVTWPSKKDMLKSVTIVLLTILVLSIICGLADLLIYNIIRFLLQI